MDTTKLKIVRSFSNRIDADVAQQHLKSAGILSFIRKDDQGGMQPSMNPIEGLFLQVNEKDAAKADKILRSRSI